MGVTAPVCFHFRRRVILANFDGKQISSLCPRIMPFSDEKHASTSVDPLEDEMKLTVLYSPFRDKQLNPKSWDQKVKFWTETILKDCFEERKAFIDITQLQEQYRRSGRVPSCLQTVVQEMQRNGQVQRLSDLENKSTDSWFSWGYNRLVKQPLGWSMKLLPWKQTDLKPEETYVVMSVIKEKARLLLEVHARLDQAAGARLVEYSNLRDQHRDMCPSDTEFALVIQELREAGQVVIQTDAQTKLIKFLQKEDKDQNRPVKIEEQDIHIHRIERAHEIVRERIETLASQVHSLGSEAVAHRKQGTMRLAMGCMRKRKLLQRRVDKLAGSMETLEIILAKIHDAQSNEMVLKAIEGGSVVLKDLTGRTRVEDVDDAMDELSEVMQAEDDMASSLAMGGGIEEPSQSELEAELSAILDEDTPTQPPVTNQDAELEKELAEIMAYTPSNSQDTSLDEMLENLQLPEVPKDTPPARTKTKTLTS